MALTINYLARTLWNHPVYGCVIAPFVACCGGVEEMVEAIEAYEGTIVWVATKPCKGVPQGYYKRVAPRPDWMRGYLSDICEDRNRCHRYCTKCAEVKHYN